ncbi:MAG: hypothetical protein IT307_12720 [Chloroflexi bacterium]|nr:hypothetical protein [Chloroflexota bacterium]
MLRQDWLAIANNRGRTTLLVALVIVGMTAGSWSVALATQAKARGNPCGRPPSVPDASSFKNQQGGPNTIDNPYFPLIPGTVFIYQGTSDGELERGVVHVTHSIKTIHLSTGDVPAIQVRDTVSVNGVPTERTLDWYAQDREGNVWYMGEDSTELPTGDKTGSWEAGVEGARPGILMKAHPKVGERYVQEFAPDQGAEDMAQVLNLNKRVSVAYGRFERVLQTKESSCLEKGAEHKYFAPGVGQVLEVGLPEQRSSKRIELVKIAHTSDDDDDSGT